MPKILPYAALAAVLALAGPALAQPAPGKTAAQAAASADPASPPASTAAPPTASSPSGTDTAANVGASTTLMSGMSVKDNTGALIGEVTAVKGGVATIKMGSDTFSVDAVRLGVQGGTATINATQAELKKMIPKK